MNTPSNVMAESQLRSEAIAPVEISPARRFYWLVARELWENRSIYLAPLAVAAVFMVGFFVALAGLPGRMRAASALGPMQQHEAIGQPYVVAALMIMAIQFLVAAFYCLEALYGERRDRSILFWKSLPVSDLETVLSKASIPILVLPLVAFAVTAATQFMMLVVSSAVLAASGMSPATVWTHVPFIRSSLINFVHLVGFHGLWYAPLYGWLLMVSAWAKRAPFLWATLPPLAIGGVERIAFNTSHFAAMLRNHFLGSPDDARRAGGMTMEMLVPHPVGHFVLDPALWIGLAVTAVFLFAAVRLRRLRGLI